MSQGAYALGDGWVLGGLAIFVGVAVLAEGVLWPAERRLQASLAPLFGGAAEVDPSVRRDVTVLGRSALVTAILVLAGTVLMVAQP